MTEVKTWRQGHFNNEKVTLKSLLNFAKLSKLDLIHRLQSISLLSTEYLCPKCGWKMKLKETTDSSDGYIWQCVRNVKGISHSVNRSLRTGTWFEDSDMTLCQILVMAYFFCYKYPSIVVRHELSIGNQEDVFEWYNYAREACVEYITKNSSPIGGPDKVVEVDVTKCAKRKHSVGDECENLLVFGGVEQGSKKCFLVNIPDQSQETLVSAIKQWVIPGSVISSGGWKPLNTIGKEVCTDLETNHLVKFVDQPAVKTEVTWKQAKYRLPLRSRSSDLCFAEYMYRRMYQDCDDFFLQFLSDCAQLFKPASKDEIL